MNKLVVPWLGIFLLCSITIQAQYTVNPGPAAATQFTSYLNQVQAGGSITFSAGSYSIGGIVVDKAITIVGAGGSTDVERRGAANTTSFITFTGGGLRVASNGVNIKNLEIKGVGIEITGKFSNLMLDNLRFTEITSGEALMLKGDKGYSGTVQYCTFQDFKIKAVVMNRRAFPDEEMLPGPLTINKCVFTASDPTGDGVRGISIDAGNDENPDAWDLNGTIFTSNTFNDCGIAFSKCANFTVGGDNIFYLSDLWDKPVHLEEFCYNAVVNNNDFVIQGAFKEGLVSLGSRQPGNNITVSNNSVTRTGTANPSIESFVSGTAVRFVDITGNTIANNVSFGGNIINFVKGHPESCGGCKDINITDNTGIAANKIKIQYEGVLADQNIANVPVGTVKEAVSPCNRPKVAGTYFIRNVAGGNLSAAVTGDAVTFSNDSNDAQRWKLKFEHPLNYTIESYTHPDYYLEVIRGAMKDEVPGFGEKYYGDTKARLVNHTTGRKPGWVLQDVGNGELKLIPGGNEFASRLSKVSDAAWLSLNKISGTVQSAGTADKWIITTAADPSASNYSVNAVSVVLGLSPNPASTQDVVRIQGEGIQSVSIWSLQGKEVFQHALPLAVSQFSIPLSYIKSGVYLVHVGLADGSSRTEKRIIR